MTMLPAIPEQLFQDRVDLIEKALCKVMNLKDGEITVAKLASGRNVAFFLGRRQIDLQNLAQVLAVEIRVE